VDTQNEIQNDLKEIWKEQNVDELRLQQKYLFKYGFIMDCIYAYYMEDDYENLSDYENIDFSKVDTAAITKVEMVEQHPFYHILTENKCASEEEIRIFMNLIISRIQVIFLIWNLIEKCIENNFN